MGPIPHMDIGEFVSEGYLQEANRRFFHPLGLALEVTVEACHHPHVEAGSFPTDHCSECDEDGKLYRISGVWDHRADPEGIVYDTEADGGVEAEKVRHVNEEWARRSGARESALGFMVQPGPDTLTILPSDTAAKRPEFLDWLRDHGIDPNVVYRVELTGPTMRVYRYRLNGEGKKFVEADAIAIEEPLVLSLASPCPVP